MCTNCKHLQTSTNYDSYWFMTFMKCESLSPMVKSKEWHQERARQVLQGVCKQRWHLLNLHSLNELESPCKIIKVFRNVILRRCSWHHDCLSNFLRNWCIPVAKQNLLGWMKMALWACLGTVSRAFIQSSTFGSSSSSSSSPVACRGGPYTLQQDGSRILQVPFRSSM